MINPQRPWRTVDDVEFATFEYIDWFNNRRLHSEIGNQPPTEAETQFYNQQTTLDTGTNTRVKRLH